MEIIGKYGMADVKTENIEQSAVSQIYEMMNSRVFENNTIKIMPDVHAGKGSVVGFTAELNINAVVPNIIGVDIGCGMYSVNLGKKEINFQELDTYIRKTIPMGMSKRTTPVDLKNVKILADIKRVADKVNPNKKGQHYEDHLRAIGSLGGGNHFIEIDESLNGDKWLIIHSGSRNFGLQVAKYHQQKAFSLIEAKRTEITDKYNKLFGEARKNNFSSERIEQIQKEKDSELEKIRVSKDLSFLTGEDAEEYIEDMQTAQIFATWNREFIAKDICNFFNMKRTDIQQFHTIHNYINLDDKIIRKGAISAQEGERVLIPLNMRDGVILAVGKGNKDWNFSAPHGAGRIMSRSEAKKSVNLEDFKETMKDVWTSSVSNSTLDESPFAYKPAEDILSVINETVDVIEVLKPIYNIKAEEAE